jgi:uncharacterized membrane protein YgdD (TMEM256/DUF423 family)
MQSRDDQSRDDSLRLSRVFVCVGALFGFLAVAAGAFGAHALRGRIGAEMLAVYQTGARYHLVHALALILVGALLPVCYGPEGQSSRLSLPAGRVAGWSFVVGITIFSGSLYALALSGVRWLGAITPIGGVALLVGWGALAVAGWRGAANQTDGSAGREGG